MSKTRSYYDVREEGLLTQVDAELGLTFAWLEDTLQPAIDLLALKCIVYEQLSDIQIFEDKKGETPVSKKSKDRINKMLDHISRLDKITSQNNTAQLVVRHSDLKMIQLLKENDRMKKELEAIELAWKSE